MINSFSSSMGSLKSEVGSLKTENSCTKMQPPSSPEESSVTESRKKIPPPPTSALSSEQLEHSSLTPSSLSFPALKFEAADHGDVEIQSPDSSSLWESFLTDQLDGGGGDFMISSPVRNNNVVQSPQCNNNFNNYSYNYVQSMHGQSLLVCSPPRNSSSPLGPYHRGKGMSPLHKVFNSPNNNNQFMQVESLSLPALESFLDDYERDDNDNEFLSSYSTTTSMKPLMSNLGSSLSDCYDMQTTTVPALLDSLTLPTSSRFCGSGSDTTTLSSVQGRSQLSHEGNDMYYQMDSISTAPLLQQLQQEQQQEKQQQMQQRRQQQVPEPQPPHRAQPPPHNTAHNLVVPLSVGPDQVKLPLTSPFPPGHKK